MNSHLHRTLSTVFLALLVSGAMVYGADFKVVRSPEALELHQEGKALLTYRLRPPPDSGLPVEAGGYFHPLKTPGGVVVTDFAPNDHRHHRGVFLAWVEMHGARDADFWGWGEHAPIKNRRIVNRSAVMEPAGELRAVNDWVAEDTVMLEEKLEAVFAAETGANILDLVYTLTPAADLTLSRWAFSGFCVRLRKDGEVAYYSPSGLATNQNPSHVKPESDWPDAPWYAASVQLKDGQRIGAAVINHPKNPPTLWHNHRDVRMINPCIVAPAEVKLKKGEPLVLRYRVVTFDGEVPSGALNKWATAWSHR